MNNFERWRKRLINLMSQAPSVPHRKIYVLQGHASNVRLFPEPGAGITSHCIQVSNPVLSIQFGGISYE